MYARNIVLPKNRSLFLFGPRATGKTTLIRTKFPNAIYIDLLDDKKYQKLLAHPDQLADFIPKNNKEIIIIDEVQRVPELLNEVHRLIETDKTYRFILTGSSARKLRRQGVNLLAGRALTYQLHPLSAVELGDDFSIEFANKYGSLPTIFTQNDPEKYLYSYVKTYLQEEVMQEGLTKNLQAFARFLEVASFSVGSIINATSIAQEVMVERKVIENYFSILEDLMVGYKLQVFTRRAKRRLVSKPKFYFFDTGVYRALRPSGVIDTIQEIDGIALENLFFQNLIAVNDSLNLNYKFYYYRTVSGTEVDFIAYGPKGFHAFEIKSSKNLISKHFRGLKSFSKDYPEAKLHLFYLGKDKMYKNNITIHPFESDIKILTSILTSSPTSEPTI